MTLLFCIDRSEKIMSLQYIEKTKWVLHFSNKQTEEVVLLGSSVMWRYLLILHFENMAYKKRKTICIFSDSFSPEDFQKLRRCVRVGYL